MQALHLNVCVASDAEASYHWLCSLLADEPFTFDWLMVAEQSLEALVNGHYHVILIDCDGDLAGPLKFLQAARAQGCRQPIIMLADDQAVHVQTEALQKGATDCLEKSEINRALLSRVLRYNAEQHDREDSYQALLEQASDAIMVLDKQLRFIEANSKANEMLGYSREELCSLRLPDIISPTQDDSLDSLVERLQRGETVTREHCLLRKDGSEVPVEASARMLDDGRLQTIVRDIADRKQAENALRASEARLRSIYNAANVGIAVVNDKGELLSANPTYCQMLGYTEDELVGRNYASLTHQDDLGKNLELFEQLLADEIDGYQYEKRYFRKDGQSIWVKYSVSPALAEDDGEARMIGVFEDITERKHAEEARAESEARLREAQRIAQLGNWEWDLRSDEISWSPQLYKMYDVDPHNHPLTVTDFTRRIHPEDQAGVWEVIQAIRNDGVARDIEYRVVRPDGEMRYFYGEGEVKHDADGTPIRMVGIAQDITDRKRAEIALQESDERFRQLTDNMETWFWLGSLKDRQLLYGSPAYEQIFGRPLESIYQAATSWRELLNPEDRERVLHILQDTDALTKPLEFDCRIVRPDGKIRWLRQRMFPVRNQDNEVYRIAGITEDITERKQSEAALRDSEERFRQLAENIEEFFWLGDLQKSATAPLYLSPAYEQIFGCPVETLYENPESWREFLHPEDRERVLQAMAHTWREHVGVDEEFRIVRPDGETRWLRERTFPVRSEAGEVYRLAGIAEDITRQKVAEAALRESDERFRQLAENIDQWFWLGELGDEPKSLYISPVYEQIFGLPLESIQSDWQSWRALIHPDDRQRVLAELDPLFAGRAIEVEFRIIRRDGKTRWLRERTFPVRDSDGEVYRIAGIAEDITARKRAEMRLRDSEARIRALLNASQDSVFLIDREGRYLALNATTARWVGRRVDELMHVASVYAGLPPDVAHLRRVRFEEVFTMGLPVRFEDSYFGRHLAISAHPVFDDSGAVDQVAVFVQDITERKQAEVELQYLYEQVKGLEDLKTLVIRVASHNLGNPVTIIENYVGFLETQLGGTLTEKQREYLVRIRKAARHVHSIREDILSLERIEERSKDFTPQIGDLRDVVEQALDNSVGQAKYRDIELDLNLPAEAVIVRSDPVQLREVLNNLLSNAIKYTPPGGRVHIEVLTQDESGCVVVRDDGPGVPKDQQHKLFKPFTRTASQSNGGEAGTGLGLYLAKRIIERHGGEVFFESAEDKGSTFGFSLPLLAEKT